MARKPLISVRLFDQPADPHVTDRGFVWLDVLAQSWPWGTFQRDAATGLSLLEFLGDRDTTIGLTTRLVLRLQDTRLARYTTAGGEWEERRPATGSPRKYRLIQTDTAADVEYAAESNFTMPSNPNLAFSLLVADTPPDWDSDALPPFVRIELGGGIWAVHLDKSGCYLLRWVDDEWQAVAEIDLPTPGAGYADAEEMYFYVRCHRGRIGVSTDLGRSYTWYGWARDETDSAALGIPLGKVTFRGRGGLAVFGMHQLAPLALALNGYWDSPTTNTFTSRGILTSPILSGRYDQPAGTGVVWADRSTPVDETARYRVTLTAKARPAVPFNVYSCPVVFSTTFRYAIETDAAAGTYTTPWDTYLMSGTIDKPFELDQSTCSFTVHLNPESAFSTNLRRRKIQVRFGWRNPDLSEEWFTVFTGYCRKPSLTRGEFGRVTLSVTADSVTELLKSAEWTIQDVLALSDFATLNVSADYILYTEGLGSGYRSWDTIGDLFPLDPGLAEDPCELIRPRERKWETLTRIFGYAGLEVAALDGGTLVTVAQDYVAPAVTHTFRAARATNTDELIQQVGNTLDYGNAATVAMVMGTAPDGTALLAWARDAEAEDNLASERFTLWREVRQEEIRGTATPGLMMARAAALALQFFPLRSEPDIVAELRPDAARRERVEVFDCAGVGIPDGAECATLTLQHRWSIDPDAGRFEHKTMAGLIRL